MSEHKLKLELDEDHVSVLFDAVMEHLELSKGRRDFQSNTNLRYIVCIYILTKIKIYWEDILEDLSEESEVQNADH